MDKPKEQEVLKNLYFIGEFDDDGNFIDFVRTRPNEQNSAMATFKVADTISGYIGEVSARTGLTHAKFHNQGKNLEVLWVEKMRITRFEKNKS